MQTFTEAVEINGSSDVTQLTIKGSIDQDVGALQSWQTNSNNKLARITSDGRLQIGTFEAGEMVTDDSLIEANRAASDTSKPTRGLHLKGGISGTLSSIVAWVVHELTLTGSAGIAALHSATRIRLRNEVTGLMTVEGELRGTDIEVTNAGGTTEDPVPHVIGLRVGLTNEPSGYIDTSYGIKVETINTGTIGQAYAVYTDNGLVHFGDAVQASMLLQNQRLTQHLSIPADYQAIYVEELRVESPAELVVAGAIFVM